MGHEVIKRDAIEGDKAVEAQRLVSRAASKALRRRRAKGQEGDCETIVIGDGTPDSEASATA